MAKRLILFGPLPPPYGGVAVYMSTLIERLRGTGVRVWTYGGARPSDKNIRFIAHRKLGTVPALICEGRGARIFDASHFHFEYPNLLLLLAWLMLKRLLGFEWYKNVHDGSLPQRHREFGVMRRWLFDRAKNGVDQFTVVSEDLKQWLEKEIKVRQRVVVIPSLLPTTPGVKNAPLSTETKMLIQRYLAHPKRVCSTGVFIPSYGFSHVAEAIEKIRRQSGQDVGLVLLDGVWAQDTTYREQVLEGRDWITVLENVPNPEVCHILKQSDMFVRAFEFESYGISRVESVLCGVPVIATRCGETRGMLTYDFGDEDQLSRLINQVLTEAPIVELSVWAAHYRREAQENLKALENTLGLVSSEPVQ